MPHEKKGLLCGRFTLNFVGFKIVLHFRVVLRLWKSLSYVCGGIYICKKKSVYVCGRFTLVGGFTFDGVTACVKKLHP